jgi:hypothetical protein
MFSAPAGTTPTGGGAQYINLGNLPAFNTQNIQLAAQNAANLALAQAQILDPYVAAQFYQNLERAFPQNQAVMAQASANTLAMLRGGLPPDVANYIRMVSAEQQVQGTHAATARNLGMTSLQMAQAGFQQAAQQAQISRYLMPPTMDVFGATARLQTALIEGTTLDPAQALQAAVQMRAQDIDYTLGQQRLRQEQARINAQLAAQSAQLQWARELSAMNRQFEQWKFNTEMELYRDALAQEQARQQAFGRGFTGTAAAGGLTGYQTPLMAARPSFAATAAGQGLESDWARAARLRDQANAAYTAAASYTAPGSPAPVTADRNFGLYSYGPGTGELYINPVTGAMERTNMPVTDDPFRAAGF